MFVFFSYGEKTITFKPSSLVQPLNYYNVISAIEQHGLSILGWDFMLFYYIQIVVQIIYFL